ncbi:MAG: amidohydrolase family protein, partial [Burkholderiales bacterium]
MTSFLIQNATGIMTGRIGAAARATVGSLPARDIRVLDGVITEVGRLTPVHGERIYDATDCVVYPGWVNTHHHLFQSLLKGVPAGINVALFPWLTAVPIRYRRFVNEENLRLAATIGIAELLLSGCTTIADHNYCYWPGMDFDGSQLLFDVAEQFGVRFMLLRGGATKVRSEDKDAPPQAAPETVEQMLTSVGRDVAKFHQPGGDAMRKMALAPSTPTWSTHPHELPELARGARKMGIMLHSHLSETADYVTYCREVHDTTPVEFVERHEWI